jgi:hypothetical protein
MTQFRLNPVYTKGLTIRRSKWHSVQLITIVRISLKIKGRTGVDSGTGLRGIPSVKYCGKADNKSARREDGMQVYAHDLGDKFGKAATVNCVRSVKCRVLRLSPQPRQRRRIVPQPQGRAETSDRSPLRRVELPRAAQVVPHSCPRQTNSGCGTIPYPGPLERLLCKSNH